MRKLVGYWGPYAAFILLAVGYAAARVPESLLSPTGFISIILILSGLAILGAVCYMCLTPSEVRKEALFGLIIAFLVCLAFMVVGEMVLSPVEYAPADLIQKSVRDQVRRRNTVVEGAFRGVDFRLAFNDLGWADDSSRRDEGGDTAVFLGDSFLEWKNSMKLSDLVEELLAEKGDDMKIRNFSKDDTDLPQYRYRFHELAAGRHLREIVLFLYGGNDLLPGYRYEPYRHDPFSVSNRALAESRQAGFPQTVMGPLADLESEQRLFRSREEFARRLDGIGLTPDQADLAYLIAYAYSCPGERNAPIFPRFFATLSKAVEKLLSFVKLMSDPPDLPNWKKLLPEYEAIFTLPEGDRLEAMAEFFSRKYFRRENFRSLLELLTGQDKEFISYLIAEPDSTNYLRTAMTRSLEEFPSYRKTPADAEECERTAEEYVKLIEELEGIARENGAGLTVVFIPEASQGDEDFYRFWLPLTDFREYFLDNHTVYAFLKEKLSGEVPVIDLGDYPERFRGGYWKMDGHWNEKGIREAAQIIAAHLRKKYLAPDYSD